MTMGWLAKLKLKKLNNLIILNDLKKCIVNKIHFQLIKIKNILDKLKSYFLERKLRF